jgi:ribonuclease-3
LTRNRLFKTALSKEQTELSKALYNILGVKTKNIYIYELAFRHKSVSVYGKNGHRDSYERLEFLGDAVIGLVVADYLFKKFPFKTEGFLTNLRSKIVCGKNLSKISQKLGFENLILVQQNMNMFSATGDVLESIIGAIYIDKGFKYTKKVVLERIINMHVDIEELVETETNFKSRLIEWAQKEKVELHFHLKDTKTVQSKKQYVVAVEINGTNIAEATHQSIKETEQLAAEKAIEILKETNRY